MNADETTLKQAARRLVRESRAAQGLPAKVRDPVVIRRVAALIRDRRHGPLGEPNA
jgi:hypothetical protein